MKPAEAIPDEVWALLDARAARLKQQQVVEDDRDHVWVAELRVAGHRYGVALELLRGCVPFRNVTPVPLAARGILGIFRYEGRILPVFSLATLLRQPWGADPSVLVLLEPAPGRWIAVDAEVAPTALTLPSAAVNAARAAAEGSVVHVPMRGEDPLRLLDPGALLGEARER